MDVRDEELVRKYLNGDAELKQLWEKHQQYENQLQKIERKPFLNESEKVEKKRLQIAKLNGKTRIEAILVRYRSI